jgi:CBS domain-containing protein
VALHRDFQKATRIAAATGSVLAIALIGLGVLNIIGGAFVQGIWQMLIGFFVYSAAGASRAHAELRGSLHGIPVSRIMRRDCVTVPADTPVQKLVDEYFYRHFYKVFPVVDGTGRPVGVIGLKDVANANRDDWRNGAHLRHHETAERGQHGVVRRARLQGAADDAAAPEQPPAGHRRPDPQGHHDLARHHGLSGGARRTGDPTPSHSRRGPAGVSA